MVDVQVHGAGLVGRWIAAGLRSEGASVRLVDPHPERRGGLPLVLPFHPEPVDRFVAAVGVAAAREIVELLQQTPATGGILWRRRPDAPDLAAALAAARELGLGVAPDDRGLRFFAGGLSDRRGAPGLAEPTYADPTAAEVDVFTVGGTDPWLADKLLPARWQIEGFQGSAVSPPEVSHHAGFFVFGGRFAAGARWATPHLEIGETDPVPNPRVTSTIERVLRDDHPDTGPRRTTVAFVTDESCDGLPIVGPIPGRPRAVVCTGFGIAEAGYGPPCARSVVDNLLGRRGRFLPRGFGAARFAGGG